MNRFRVVCVMKSDQKSCIVLASYMTQISETKYVLDNIKTNSKEFKIAEVGHRVKVRDPEERHVSRERNQ